MRPARIDPLAIIVGAALVIPVAVVVAYLGDPETVLFLLQGDDLALAFAMGGAACALALAIGLLRGTARQLVAVLLVIVLSATAVAGGSDYLARREGLARLRPIAQRVIDAVAPPADAQLYVVRDPYPDGDLVIRPQSGAPITAETSGETWFAIIDLEPGAMLGHPIRYALVSGEAVRTIDAEWFATVGGVPFWTLTDGLSVAGHDVGVLEPGRSGDAASPSLLRTLGASLRKLVPPAAAAAGTRKAVIIDGGDEEIELRHLIPFQLMRRLAKVDVRIEMNRHANELATLLPGYGYDVTRLSGMGADPSPVPTLQNVRAAITRAAEGLGRGDELYLHTVSHGSQLGLVVYDKAYQAHNLYYADLAEILRGLDPGLKKVVAIDACHAGAAADVLGSIPGVELHTAVGADRSAPAGIVKLGGGARDPSWTQSLIDSLGAPGTGPRADPVGEGLAAAGAAFRTLGAVSSTPEGRLANARKMGDVDLRVAQVKAAYAANTGRSLTVTCPQSGSIPVPAAFSCPYVDSTGAKGAVAMRFAADASFGYTFVPDPTPTLRLVTLPPSFATSGPSTFPPLQPRTAPPTACPTAAYENSSWATSYGGTPRFTLGRSTDCRSLPVSGIQATSLISVRTATFVCTPSCKLVIEVASSYSPYGYLVYESLSVSPNAMTIKYWDHLDRADGHVVAGSLPMVRR